MGKKADKRSRNTAANTTGSLFKIDKKTVAVCVVIFAVLFAVMRHFDESQSLADLADNKLPLVDISDTAALKEIFLSGNPHIVHCVSNSTARSKTPKKLNDLVGEFKTVKLARINCWFPTESGKTLAQRFKIPNSDPVTITVANLNAPKTLTLKGGIDKIKKQIAKNIKPIAIHIHGYKEWNSLCRSRKQCIVIASSREGIRKTAETTLRPFMTENRALRVVSVDSGYWQMKLEDAFSDQLKDGSEADIICIVKNDQGIIRAGLMPSWQGDTPKEFLQNCASGGEESWSEQFDSVELMVRQQQEEKIKVMEKPKEEDAPKKDKVGSRANIDEDDEGAYFTPEEKTENDDEEADEIEM